MNNYFFADCSNITEITSQIHKSTVQAVRSSAAKSGEIAQNTGVFIGCSMQDVKTGTESTNHAIAAMRVINDCIQSIKTLMDEIVLASVQQSEMIASIEGDH